MGPARASITFQETTMKCFVTACAAALFGLTSVASAATDKPAEPAKKPAATAAAGNTPAKAAPRAAAAKVETRDWAKIDTNKDNLISPEEMERYLKENPGPLRSASN
jgi:hypothetical protein